MADKHAPRTDPCRRTAPKSAPSLTTSPCGRDVRGAVCETPQRRSARTIFGASHTGRLRSPRATMRMSGGRDSPRQTVGGVPYTRSRQTARSLSPPEAAAPGSGDIRPPTVGNGRDIRRSRRFGRHADAVSSWRVATTASARLAARCHERRECFAPWARLTPTIPLALATHDEPRLTAASVAVCTGTAAASSCCSNFFSSVSRALSLAISALSSSSAML